MGQRNKIMAILTYLNHVGNFNHKSMDELCQGLIEFPLFIFAKQDMRKTEFPLNDAKQSLRTWIDKINQLGGGEAAIAAFVCDLYNHKVTQTDAIKMLIVDPSGKTAIRPDPVHRAGLGVKTICHISRNQEVAVLATEKHFCETAVDDAIELETGGFCLTTIGVPDKEREVGSFVNDVCNFKPNKISPLEKKKLCKQGLLTNSQFSQCGPRKVIVTATRAIRINTFVYANYGTNYKKKQTPMQSPPSPAHSLLDSGFIPLPDSE